MDSQRLLSIAFTTAHPADVAENLDQLSVEDVVDYLGEIPPDIAAQTISFMSPVVASKCLEGMKSTLAVSIISYLSLEISALLLRRIDTPRQVEVLKILPDSLKQSLELLLKYPEDSAGALMNPQVITIFEDLTVKEAIKFIIRHPRHVYFHLPVITRDQLLVGLTDMRHLMLSKPEELVSSITHSDVGRLSPNSSREAILVHPDWRIYHELPVVDENGIFMGLIGYQTIRRLEYEIGSASQAVSTVDAGRALGELYWIGLSAFLKGAFTMVNPDKK
jgi:magnesium transporter